MSLAFFVNEMREKNSASADGVLAPGSAHAGPSAQPPIATSGNFPACVSAESSSPNFPISGQNRVNWGCRGDSPNIFFFGFLIFSLLRSSCKISKL